MPWRPWLYASAFLIALRLLRRQKGRSMVGTADAGGECQASEEPSRLQVLLTAYSVERQDNASEVHTIATFVGFVLAYLVGAIAVLSSAALQPKLNPRIVLVVPSVPVVLFAWISLFVGDANLRRRYLLELESQIREELHCGSSEALIEIPSWMSWNARVFEPGHRPKVRLILSAATIVVFGGAATLLILTIVAAYLILPMGYKPWLLVIYLPSLIAPVVIFTSSNLWIHRLLRRDR
jgi:hypothetical protein